MGSQKGIKVLHMDKHVMEKSLKYFFSMNNRTKISYVNLQASSGSVDSTDTQIMKYIQNL